MQVRWLWISWLLLVATAAGATDQFTVATYNLENYLDAPVAGRTVKSAEAKARVRDTLLALRADVLALQEIGSTNALLQLRDSLKSGGLDYPHWEHVAGADTNIYVAVLSRFPLDSRRPHVNDSFLLGERRFRVSRGFAEVTVRVTPRHQFTLLVAHLKSKRPVPQADEAVLREQEARLLREKVDALLKANPELKLIVAGDLNDHRDSKPVRAILGRGRGTLIDLRPEASVGEVRGDGPVPTERQVAWTYFYSQEDTYSRFDYLLISRGLQPDWEPSRTYALALPYWREASDHRPILATFRTERK